MGDVSRSASGRSADATLLASRALLGVVARSLIDALQEVTLPQFRVLVILSSAGPMRMGAIAERMSAHPSTFSRTVDRLVAGGWVRRESSLDSRRETLIVLSSSGGALVERVSSHRRSELERILGALNAAERAQLEAAFALFAAAAGEPDPADLLVLGL